ncbi:hypothetical protein [Aquiflexum sp.]|uniref:hypothetical protein n=1 Tax=Aquiflexum sp. TaxID=1872584 RepID=UPI0035934350
MKKITGIISLIGCFAGITLLFIWMYMFNYSYTNHLDSLAIVFCLLGIYYVVATRFDLASSPSTVLENLEKENNFVRKQIEKRRLLAKLDNMDKK